MSRRLPMYKDFESWYELYGTMDDAWFAHNAAICNAIKRIAKRAYNRGKHDARLKKCIVKEKNDGYN